jgi:predicted nucleotidyltransferase component of viral defense system
MNIKIIEERLGQYPRKTKQEEKNALREIAHEIALCGLTRTDFFKRAAFTGGSCLRIFYGLQRFSEDLDFWTLQPELNFDWKPYLQSIKEEFKAHGFDMQITDRGDADRKIKRAFLKQESIGKVLVLTHSRRFADNENLQIKFEIDTNPPHGAGFESKSTKFPQAFTMTALDRPSLFAGKIAALLDPEHAKDRKGRHWYDFAWYVFKKWPLNLTLLGNACKPPEKMTLLILQKQLVEEGKSTDIALLKKDLAPLLPLDEQQTIDSWGSHSLLGYIDGLQYLIPEPISLGALIANGKGKQLIDQIKEAIANGAPVNCDARNGHRPLQLALSNGHEEVARLLVEHGADIHYRDRSGQTPLQAAINNGQFGIAKLLTQKGVSFNPDTQNLGFDYTKLYQFRLFWQK